MELRVKDAGESECHSVIEWIGVEVHKPTSSYAKAGANGTFDDFQQVSHHERA